MYVLIRGTFENVRFRYTQTYSTYIYMYYIYIYIYIYFIHLNTIIDGFQILPDPTDIWLLYGCSAKLLQN